MPLEFSKEITNMVHGLEVLQNFNSIQDINYSAFLKYTEKLAFAFDKEAFKGEIPKIKNMVPFAPFDFVEVTSLMLFAATGIILLTSIAL